MSSSEKGNYREVNYAAEKNLYNAFFVLDSAYFAKSCLLYTSDAADE